MPLLYSRRSLRPLILLLALQVLVAPPAVGQDAEAADEPDRLTGDSSFGLTVTEGNSETLSLNFSGRIAYALPLHTWSFSTGVLRTRDAEEVKANKGDVAFQYAYEPSERFFLNTQFRASYNRPAGIERRLSPGVGVGYDLLRTEHSRLSLDGGVNWVDERFTDDTGESSVYFNFAQEYKLRVNETTDLEQRLAYSPRPENLSDYLVHAELALTTRVWKLLGIKTQIRDDYDSTPFVDPETGEARSRNDFTFITGVNISF